MARSSSEFSEYLDVSRPTTPPWTTCTHIRVSLGPESESSQPVSCFTVICAVAAALTIEATPKPLYMFLCAVTDFIFSLRSLAAAWLSWHRAATSVSFSFSSSHSFRAFPSSSVRSSVSFRTDWSCRGGASWPGRLTA
ncbi:hypothetical protein EYF80_036633 [Liparis tanakae]|uniref:Uncharacterized protein n=1 Tax=Liparis tanakae TaxID=230148 RepID=A0A4Z2GKB7_9TELE|nr:hypothetical protein EYF80_036633 [Liparis tanakae]